MVSNGRDHPAFSTDSSSLTPDISLPSFGSPRAGNTSRAATRVKFTNHQLGGATLDNEKYYIPTTATLFDSFDIDLDPHTVVISFFPDYDFPKA